MKSSRAKSQKRAQRVRMRLRKVANGRPRLSVFRSSKYIYAQIIDDVEGRTVAAASSLEDGARQEHAKSWDVKAAEIVGRMIAERAKEKGVTDVVFDRGAYLFHGRVKALADAAREGGLSF